MLTADASEGRKRQYISEDGDGSPSKPEKVRCILQEERLKQFSDALSLPSNITQAADTMFKELSESQDLDCDEDLMCCCLLYIAMFDTRSPCGPQDPQGQNGNLTTPVVSVTDLLCYANRSVSEFFTALQAIRKIKTISDLCSQALFALERKFCIVSPLFVKFEKVFQEIFLTDDLSNPANVRFSEVEGYNYKKKLCWSLFVYTKGLILKVNHSLVVAFQLLLTSLEHVISVTPSFQLKQPFDLLRQSSSQTLPELCTLYGVNHEEVRSVMSSFESVLKELAKNNPIELWAIQDAYTDLYRKGGDIDELLFLSHHKHLMPTQNEQCSSQPSVGKVPQTPVSFAVNTVQNLHVLLEAAHDKPSPGLTSYFQECINNPHSAIMERLEKMRKDYIQGFTTMMGESHANLGHQRFTQATKLYFRVMESLLKLEEVRLQRRDFSLLLHSNIFHKSLFCCAIIVIMASYSPKVPMDFMSLTLSPRYDDTTMAFPWILRVLGLQAYDFYKVIESFIKAEHKLTKDIIKHLQEVENKVLDSIAWESASSLYQILEKTDFPRPPTPHPSTPDRLTPTSELFQSPVHGIQSNTYAALESPKSPTLRGSQTLNIFFNKVCRLAYRRLQNLCTQLMINNDLQQKIWTCLVHCLSHNWVLMKDRHLDQLMMCSVYAICRVQDKEIKFKRIVNEYSTLPQASLQTYKNVLIQGSDCSSIITFYNVVFMPRLKDYILQFTDARQTPSMSPLPKSVPSPLSASPVYRVAGRKNFYVSPMKESPFKSPLTSTRMTPRTRQLYSFGEGLGSAEKLKAINESVKSAQRMNSPIISRNQTCLSFDMPTDSSLNKVDDQVIKWKRTSSSSRSRKSLNFDVEPQSDSPAKLTFENNNVGSMNGNAGGDQTEDSGGVDNGSNGVVDKSVTHHKV